MTAYVALLRGINVGGKNLIKMADLKACFERQVKGAETPIRLLTCGNRSLRTLQALGGSNVTWSTTSPRGVMTDVLARVPEQVQSHPASGS